MGKMYIPNFLVIFNIILLLDDSNTLQLEDLEVMFHQKRCIEASLISHSTHGQAQELVMLDADLDSAIEKQKLALINMTESKETTQDKSVLSKINTLAQYNEIQYNYELVDEEGPSHDKTFTISLTLGDEKYTGIGPSLKKAQKAAATQALAQTFYEAPPVRDSDNTDNDKAITPTVILNNVAVKMGLAVSYNLVTDTENVVGFGSNDVNLKNSNKKWNFSIEPLWIPIEDRQISGPFSVKVKVDDSAFVGNGHTIQAAKHDAATKALKEIEKQLLYKNNVCTREETVDECNQKRESLKSPITRVHEAAQKHKLPVEFNVIREEGKPHNKIFVTQCILGDFISEGQGRSIKESKKAASEKMLENFVLLPEITDGGMINQLISEKKNKKRKKKKVKKPSSGLGISDMISSLWDSGEDTQPKDSNDAPQNTKQSKSGDISSSKDKILQIGHMLNIDVQFVDFKRQGNFYTLMSIGLDPKHVCLGKAVTREKSHLDASLHGLKFLYKLGLLEKAGLMHDKEISEYIQSGYFEEGNNVVPSEMFEDS